MHTVYGRCDDSIGMMIAGHFTKNTGYPICGAYSAMGWIKDGKLIGQAVFENYNGANIDIHLHFPRGISRRTVNDVYKYVFEFLKVKRLTAKPNSRNEKLLQVLGRLGFVYECTQENYYKDGTEILDAIVYKLTPDNIPNWVK